MIKAGELNQRITFQRATLTRQPGGQKTETWADAATVYAAVITTGGSEFYAAQKKNAETSAVFKIRFTNAVNVKMRIVYGRRIFHILPPINDVNAKHEIMLISAKEVV